MFEARVMRSYWIAVHCCLSPQGCNNDLPLSTAARHSLRYTSAFGSGRDPGVACPPAMAGESCNKGAWQRGTLPAHDFQKSCISTEEICFLKPSPDKGKPWLSWPTGELPHLAHSTGTGRLQQQWWMDTSHCFVVASLCQS